MLDESEYRKYLEQVLEIFRPAQTMPNLQVIIDREQQIVFASDLSAQSVGLTSGAELCQVSFKNTVFDHYYNDQQLRQMFGNGYSDDTRQKILDYSNKLIKIQSLVLRHGVIIKFMDMLPYNNQLVTYLTTYCPLFHPSGEVIAIHSTAVQSYILRFQGHLQPPEAMNENYYKRKNDFTVRELEILFLLSNGASQEQVAQMLNIARGTVSAIITNQLCPKFSIAGANTKLLVREAIDGGYYRQMPVSLWHPQLIILNEELPAQPAV